MPKWGQLTLKLNEEKYYWINSQFFKVSFPSEVDVFSLINENDSSCPYMDLNKSAFRVVPNISFRFFLEGWKIKADDFKKIVKTGLKIQILVFNKWYLHLENIRWRKQQRYWNFFDKICIEKQGDLRIIEFIDCDETFSDPLTYFPTQNLSWFMRAISESHLANSLKKIIGIPLENSCLRNYKKKFNLDRIKFYIKSQL